MMRTSALVLAACLTACGGADFDNPFGDLERVDSGIPADPSDSGGTRETSDAGDGEAGSMRGVDAALPDSSAVPDAGAGDAGASDGSDSRPRREAGLDGGSDATPDANRAACDHAIRVYVDGDKDGFGDPATGRMACSIPADYVDNGDDCYDLNSSAKPGQSNSFPTDRGDGSFDYDCDGDETAAETAKGLCPGIGVCIATVGWDGDVPGCGVEHPWVTGCGTLAICPTQTEPRTQHCR